MTKAVVSPVAVVANPEIVKLLDSASVHAASADKLARDAAVMANQTECLDIAISADRVAAIGAMYRPNLANQTVKLSFMAALSILVADKPVRFAANARTDNPAKGTTSFDKPEDLSPVEPTDGDDITEGKTVFEMSAEDAIARLPANLLKMAAPKANEAIGRAREARHVAKKATARAPFFDEMASVLRDEAYSIQFWSILTIAAKSDHAVRAKLEKALVDCGYEVKRLSAKPAATAK